MVGGGLAGLAVSIQLVRQGHTVVLLEREVYPFHKVCGEYISMESWDFLLSLGLPLQSMNLPRIRRLQVSAPDGESIMAPLSLGGFGISRYFLDDRLAGIARMEGVQLLEGAKVQEVARKEEGFEINFVRAGAGSQRIRAKVCCAGYGKRSNLDVRWNRDFLKDPASRLQNYIGVKYHVRAAWPDDLIGLHNFEDGYCGISRVEEGRYCLCYLTTAANLKKAGHSLSRLENEVLARNPFLRTLFRDCRPEEGFPLTISQISFKPKSQVEEGVLMMGDAAGMITPLCGNGMSMALHGSKMAAAAIDRYLKGLISRPQMEKEYTTRWKKTFAGRLRAGRILQHFFGASGRTNRFVRLFKRFPFLISILIKKTHGRPF